MKYVSIIPILIVSLGLVACDASATESVNDFEGNKIESQKDEVFQVDDSVHVENGDDDVKKISESRDETPDKENEEEQSKLEDLTLLTPEDIAFIDNLGNQDWLFKDDSNWMMRFDDDVLIIGQPNGQVTDALRFSISRIDHSEKTIIIHVVERLNEHSQLNETSIDISYYCQLQLNGDELTYTNRLNSPSLSTETVWIRKK